MPDAIECGPVFNLREQIMAHIRSLQKPVLVDDAAQSFSLSAASGSGETEWRLEVEFGKLLLEVWGGGHSIVRRIERVEADDGRLRLWAHKPGWSGRPVALEIREAGDGNQRSGSTTASEAGHEAGSVADPAVRRTYDRSSFERELTLMLAREAPGLHIERVSHRSDREHSFSGCFTRGWARRGREAWAFLGLSENEGPWAVENALAYGLIWLDWLRESASSSRRSPLVAGLKLVLPPAAVAVAAHRAAHLDPRAAAVEILQWTRGQEHPNPVDLGDYGNVETRLTPRWRGARLVEELQPLLRELLGEHSGRVQAVPDAAGEALSLRVLGLEVARIESRGLPRVYFGLEGERVLLNQENRGEWAAFLEDVLNLRRPRGPDRSHPFYRLQPERWLESLLVEDIGRIDSAFVPEHVYPQVPAFSGPATPALSRGVIDILGVVRDRQTGSHRLAVVELKLDEDPHLPLQGLDYWLRVKWLEDRDQFREFGFFPGLTPSPAPPVLYLVCPAFRFHSSTERVLRYFDPSIRVVKVGVNQRWREGVKVLFRKILEQGRAIEEPELRPSCDDDRLGAKTGNP